MASKHRHHNSWGPNSLGGDDTTDLESPQLAGWTGGNFNIAAVNFSDVGRSFRHLPTRKHAASSADSSASSMPAVDDPERIGRLSLVFVNSPILERWFLAYFYLQNKRPAFLGMIITLLVDLVITIITARQPMYDYPANWVPMYLALLLCVVASASAGVNMFVQERFYPQYNIGMKTPNSKQLILKDDTSY
jgi:hypothetical protein